MIDYSRTLSMAVDTGPTFGQGRGGALLGIGVVIEVVGTAIEVAQEQNVYTINPSITLPALAAMLVGVVLVAVGYRRLLGASGAGTARWLEIGGVGCGAILLASALDWQLEYALIPSGDLDLEVYLALPLFFVGVAVLTTAIGAVTAAPSTAEGLAEASANETRAARALGLGLPTAAVAAGAGVLATAALASGWLNTQAANINSLYQLVALELALGGAWLLVSGASGLLARRTGPRLLGARRAGLLAGLVIVVAGGVSWWRTAPLVYALSEILLAGFLLAGVGLLFVSRPRPEVAA